MAFEQGGLRHTAAANGKVSFDVLYVEDHPINAMLMQAIFAQRPHLKLRIAGTAQEGHEAALAQVPDLLLLDLRLPDGHGIDLLAKLRLQPSLARVRAVAVTSEKLEHLRGTTFAELWTKPLDIGQVLRRLDQWLPAEPAPELSPVPDSQHASLAID